jgi:streptogramin lyase
VVTEFSAGISPGAEPWGITAGPDGNVWFTEARQSLPSNTIGRITPAGIVREFSKGISADALPYHITTGPDGRIWFTEGFGNRIARIK